MDELLHAFETLRAVCARKYASAGGLEEITLTLRNKKPIVWVVPDHTDPPRPSIEPQAKPNGHSEAKNANSLTVCQSDILKLLEDAQERMVTDKIITALKDDHGVSTIQKAILELKKSGHIDNTNDRRGKGYGLPIWKELDE